MSFLSQFQRLATSDRRVRPRAVLAFAFGAALVAAALAMAVREAETPRGAPIHPAAGHPADSLAGEFTRCQALGEAGAHDVACLAAWAENRRRFLMPDRRTFGVNPAASPEEGR